MGIKAIDDMINQQLDERLKVPAFSESAVQFLHILFNERYVSLWGNSKLKAAGYSDAYIAGFIAGLGYASESVDSALAMRQSLKDNIQFD
ncbi:hypothetical protein [Enterobacter phage 02_vB_Eclo_IJM]|nr:hypothetical protein [Enterobacter phage 02_vB_Eclo_IJM]